MASTKTLIQALHEKYDDSADDVNSSVCEIYIPSKGSGKSDSGAFRIPDLLGLESLGISCAGDGEQISSLCSNVKELDISDNIITYWTEVFGMLDSLPKLEFLNLTRNPLTQLSADERRYPKLKKLVLNFTNLTWTTVQHLLTMMPNLEELYLSGNSYDDIGLLLDMPAYETLRLLQLTDNKLNDWNHVIKLDQLFPKLSCLILANNAITQCGSVEDNGAIFSSLTVLYLNNTLISEWNELDKLSAIKSLTDIRLSSIPLVKGITDRRKLLQLLSVHFPTARLLNGSRIPPEELDTSERVYIRHFQDSADKPNKLAEVEAKHGKLERLVEVDLKPKFSVALTFICGEREQVFDIPTKQTVGEMKRSVTSFVGTPKFRLCMDSILTNTELISSMYNRFVHSYKFEDGDRIHCIRLEDPMPKYKAKPRPGV